jgi:hypothetical protein
VNDQRQRQASQPVSVWCPICAAPHASHFALNGVPVVECPAVSIWSGGAMVHLVTREPNQQARATG